MVAMGGVMWLMMRANKGKSGDPMQGQMTSQTTAPVQPSDQLIHLHAQLDDVQAQMQRIAAEGRSAPSPGGTPLAPASSGRGTSGMGGR